MIITLNDPDDVDFEIDTERYKHDAGYRTEIHERMELTPGQADFDWDYICASEEELRAMGEKPAFSTADYPTEEAAMEALDKFLDDIWEEALRERDAKDGSGAPRTSRAS